MGVLILFVGCFSHGLPILFAQALFNGLRTVYWRFLLQVFLSSVFKVLKGSSVFENSFEREPHVFARGLLRKSYRNISFENGKWT